MIQRRLDAEIINELGISEVGRLGWEIPDDPHWAQPTPRRLRLAQAAILLGCGIWLAVVAYVIF